MLAVYTSSWQSRSRTVWLLDSCFWKKNFFDNFGDLKVAPKVRQYSPFSPSHSKTTKQIPLSDLLSPSVERDSR